MRDEAKKAVQALFEDINPKSGKSYDRSKFTTWSRWVPIELKRRYRALPKESREEIGERIQVALEVAVSIVEGKLGAKAS